MECVLSLPMVPSLNGRSYQCMLAGQLVKLGGLGLRSLVETRYPAFMGALEQSVPFLVASDQCESPLAPSLAAMMGSMAGNERWAEMLGAASRTAAEFRDGWSTLSGEARNIFDYVGEEPSGSLADSLEGVGGASVKRSCVGTTSSFMELASKENSSLDL